MNSVIKTIFNILILILLLPLAPLAGLRAADGPQHAPASSVMLSGPWLPDNPHQLDFDALPKLPSEHAVVSDVRDLRSTETVAKPNTQPPLLKYGGYNNHNYLAHHDGQFWAMWSDGPSVEDKVGQVIKCATSPDGLTWSKPELLTPYPPGSAPGSPHYGGRTAEGLRWIARGFWQRDGDLLALASLDEAGGFFGKSLALHAFGWEGKERGWVDRGVILDDAINNFPPQKLPNGDWMMSRRRFDYKKRGVEFAVGGVKALDDWKSFPVLGSSSELKAEEPDWWVLPDGNLCALFRDNRKRGFLYRSFSTDSGRTWSPPVQTNFPDATSKVRGLRLSDGRYVLVSNPDPKKREPLTLAISDDGLVFTKMLRLVGGRRAEYPHVIEHEGSLFIAFSGGKMTMEVLKVKLGDVDAVKMPEKPLIADPKP